MISKKIIAIIYFFITVSVLNAQTTNLGPDTIPGGRIPIPTVSMDLRQTDNPSEMAMSVQLLLIVAFMSLAPAFMVLMTSFLRISIVLDFVKRALGLQQVPPTQVLNGIALFLTLFIMWPVFDEMYNNAYKPMTEGKLNVSQMYSEAEKPIRMFMYRQMENNTDNIKLFMKLRGLNSPKSLADVPTYVLIPAFILNELTVAFKIGVYIYIPFVIIDMVVASILMAMGMIMLPPVMISMPFKLILFWLLDGWTLITQQLMAGFR